MTEEEKKIIELQDLFSIALNRQLTGEEEKRANTYIDDLFGGKKGEALKLIIAQGGMRALRQKEYADICMKTA